MCCYLFWATGGPAERSGRVEIGDEIVFIESHSVDTLLSDGEETSVHKLLSGEPGTAVTLIFRRSEAGYSQANERCHPSQSVSDYKVTLTRVRRRGVGKSSRAYDLKQRTLDDKIGAAPVIPRRQVRASLFAVPSSSLATASPDCVNSVSPSPSPEQFTSVQNAVFIRPKCVPALWKPGGGTPRCTG